MRYAVARQNYLKGRLLLRANLGYEDEFDCPLHSSLAIGETSRRWMGSPCIMMMKILSNGVERPEESDPRVVTMVLID